MATSSLGLGPSLSMRDLGLAILSRHFSALLPRCRMVTPSVFLIWSWPLAAVTDLMEAKGIFRRRPSERKTSSLDSRRALPLYVWPWWSMVVSCSLPMVEILARLLVVDGGKVRAYGARLRVGGVPRPCGLG